jgi:hypothetical protein
MRIGVGLGLMAWSVIGLHVSGRAEERLGIKPNEEDEANLRKYVPRVVTVDRESSGSGSSDSDGTKDR